MTEMTKRVGRVFEGVPVFARSPRPRPALPVAALSRRAAVMCLGLDPDEAAMGALVGSRPDGPVVEATGGGHIARKALPFLEKARQQGTAVVLCTRVPEGPLLTRTYGFEGSETDLRHRGIHMSNRNAQKTRLKMLVALEQGDRELADKVLSDPDW